MVLRNEVANSPSDPGGERSVSNSLLVVSSAPLGPLAHLSVIPDEAYLMHSTTLQFSADGFDQYFNPVDVDPAEKDRVIGHRISPAKQAHQCRLATAGCAEQSQGLPRLNFE